MKKLLFGVMVTVMVIMLLGLHIVACTLIYWAFVKTSTDTIVASIMVSLPLLGLDATFGWMYFDVKEGN